MKTRNASANSHLQTLTTRRRTSPLRIKMERSRIWTMCAMPFSNKSNRRGAPIRNKAVSWGSKPISTPGTIRPSLRLKKICRCQRALPLNKESRTGPVISTRPIRKDSLWCLANSRASTHHTAAGLATNQVRTKLRALPRLSKISKCSMLDTLHLTMAVAGAKQQSMAAAAANLAITTSVKGPSRRMTAMSANVYSLRHPWPLIPLLAKCKMSRISSHWLAMRERRELGRYKRRREWRELATISQRLWGPRHTSAVRTTNRSRAVSHKSSCCIRVVTRAHRLRLHPAPKAITENIKTGTSPVSEGKRKCWQLGPGPQKRSYPD